MLVVGAVVAVAYWYRVTNQWRGTDPLVMGMLGVLGLIFLGFVLVFVIWLSSLRDARGKK